MIKKLKIPGFLMLDTNAQEVVSATNNSEDYKGFFLGATISTNGWGGEVKYVFNKRFTVRTGYETLNLSKNIDYTQDDIDFETNFDYKTGSVFLLGDIFYTRNLYLSGGVLFNSFNPKITGYATSDLQYGDITIPASMLGGFTFTVTPELKISPYAALGVRSLFGKKKRLMWTTEVGCFYMGAPQVEIEASGLVAPTGDPAHGQKENLESQIEQYKFYPVLKMGLAVKLF
jgi:hypothetical protein